MTKKGEICICEICGNKAQSVKEVDELLRAVGKTWLCSDMCQRQMALQT